MSPVWQLVEQHVEKNWEIYSAAGGALLFAAIACMPPRMPRSWDEWWGWARSTFQTAVPVRHTVVAAADPILPENPAQPKK